MKGTYEKERAAARAARSSRYRLGHGLQKPWIETLEVDPELEQQGHDVDHRRQVERKRRPDPFRAAHLESPVDGEVGQVAGDGKEAAEKRPADHAHGQQAGHLDALRDEPQGHHDKDSRREGVVRNVRHHARHEEQDQPQRPQWERRGDEAGQVADERLGPDPDDLQPDQQCSQDHGLEHRAEPALLLLDVLRVGLELRTTQAGFPLDGLKLAGVAPHHQHRGRNPDDQVDPVDQWPLDDVGDDQCQQQQHRNDGLRNRAVVLALAAHDEAGDDRTRCRVGDCPQAHKRDEGPDGPAQLAFEVGPDDQNGRSREREQAATAADRGGDCRRRVGAAVGRDAVVDVVRQEDRRAGLSCERRQHGPEEDDRPSADAEAVADVLDHAHHRLHVGHGDIGEGHDPDQRGRLVPGDVQVADSLGVDVVVGEVDDAGCDDARQLTLGIDKVKPPHNRVVIPPLPVGDDDVGAGKAVHGRHCTSDNKHTGDDLLTDERGDDEGRDKRPGKT